MSATNFSKLAGFSSALVSWKRKQLVGRAAALGDEEELVLVALGGVDVDLGGQVRAGVRLLPHVQGRDLGVAEVLLGVALVDAAAEPLGVVGAGPDLLALLGDDGGGAGVLAHRQDALGGDLGVLEQRQRHVTVVGRGLGVVEDRGDLLEVLGPQEEGAVVERLLRQEGERLRLDLEDLPALEDGRLDALLREQAVGGVVGPERAAVPGSGRGAWHGAEARRLSRPRRAGAAPPSRLSPAAIAATVSASRGRSAGVATSPWRASQPLAPGQSPRMRNCPRSAREPGDVEVVLLVLVVAGPGHQAPRGSGRSGRSRRRRGR